jgi:hypothetical protein
MSVMTMNDLRQLAAINAGPSLSSYLRMHRTRPGSDENPRRLKAMLRQAEHLLAGTDLTPGQRQDFLGPCRTLLEDRFFWEHQDHGLALFLAPQHFHYFRLPYAPEETTLLLDRFYLNPLLPLVTDDGRFYLLALAQKSVRFYEGSRSALRLLEVSDLPDSLETACPDMEFQNQLQMHTATAGGGRTVVYHGSGEGRDELKKRLLEFFRRVDHALQNTLRDHPAPLLLAAVDYYFPIYHEAAHNPHLLPECLPGSPEHLTHTELHQRAWPIVEPYLHAKVQAALQRARELVGTARTSTDPVHIAMAACEGRLDTLITGRGRRQWAAIDCSQARFELHADRQPGDEDLLDYATFQTLLHRGQVYVVDPNHIPRLAPAIALFRYGQHVPAPGRVLAADWA